MSSHYPLKNPFYLQSMLSVQHLTRQELHLLFGMSLEMQTLVERHQPLTFLQGRVLSTLFYEPSTRTCSSFESAWQRLGGSLVSVKPESSSIMKGESWSDTVRTLAMYSDCLVMRHPEKGAVSMAAKVAKIPVINAGDGIGEHPTQALLDVYTIREELGTVNGLTITFVGDLKHGRTVHSLAKLLSLYDVKLNYCAPESLQMPEAIQHQLHQHGIVQHMGHDVMAFIKTTDVLYVTRIQKERFEHVSQYEKVQHAYHINPQVLKSAKSQMIVMHPLPRLHEISPEVDFDPRAAYFRQMRYGLFVRMALLALIMGKP
ncbi:Oxidoreductase [Coelomomyces lativittatus]|nr:Oxidoreductase [Coelomomyces lativittatus]